MCIKIIPYTINKSKHIYTAVTHPTCILEIPSMNLSCSTDYPVNSQVNARLLSPLPIHHT